MMDLIIIADTESSKYYYTEWIVKLPIPYTLEGNFPTIPTMYSPSSFSSYILTMFWFSALLQLSSSSEFSNSSLTQFDFVYVHFSFI